MRKNNTEAKASPLYSTRNRYLLPVSIYKYHSKSSEVCSLTFDFHSFSECRATFLRQKFLDIHMETHIKPTYYCDACKRTYATRFALEEHCRKMHVNQDRRQNKTGYSSRYPCYGKIVLSIDQKKDNFPILQVESSAESTYIWKVFF